MWSKSRFLFLLSNGEFGSSTHLLFSGVSQFKFGQSRYFSVMIKGVSLGAGGFVVSGKESFMVFSSINVGVIDQESVSATYPSDFSHYLIFNKVFKLVIN